MAEQDSPESQIKEAIWKWSGWTIMVLLTFLAGVAVAYLTWGDAPSLRGQVKDLTQKVAGARTEREDMQAVVNRVQRENEKLQEQIAELKKSAAPAAP
jgi:uncharacterized protein YpmS